MFDKIKPLFTVEFGCTEQNEQVLAWLQQGHLCRFIKEIGYIFLNFFFCTTTSILNEDQLTVFIPVEELIPCIHYFLLLKHNN